MKLAISTLRKIINEEVKRAIRENAGQTKYYTDFMNAFNADSELGYDHDASMVASSAVSQGASYLMDPMQRNEVNFIFKNAGLKMPKSAAETLSALNDYLAAQKDFQNSNP